MGGEIEICSRVVPCSHGNIDAKEHTSKSIKLQARALRFCFLKTNFLQCLCKCQCQCRRWCRDFEAEISKWPINNPWNRTPWSNIKELQNIPTSFLHYNYCENERETFAFRLKTFLEHIHALFERYVLIY